MTSILALEIDNNELHHPTNGWLRSWLTTPPAAFVDKDGNAPVILGNDLPTGDMRILCVDGHTLLVERKTPSDFLSSIPTDHIFDQANRMMQERRNNGGLPFLVITGEILRNPQTGKCIIPGSKHGEGWNWHAVQGALLSIQEAGVPVIFCAGDLDYAPCLERLAQRDHSKMIINPTREIMPLTPEERVLCAFDGIGPELAGRILDGCTTPAWALDVLTDISADAPKIAGIADGRKKAIRRVLGLTDDLTIRVVAV